jgi:Mrp family chromosome partitioning ATPase
MGEIADALRRAAAGERGPAPAERPEPAAPPPTSSQKRAAPAARASLAEPDPGLQEEAAEVAELAPSDPAIATVDVSAVQACRQLAFRLRAVLEARGARSVAVLSAVRNEGKTTVACDLALALASLSKEHEIALLDLDLRRPSVARVLNTPPEVGIEAVLAGRASLGSVRRRVGRPSFDVYAAAEPLHDAHELLERGTLDAIMDDLQRRYRVVVVDTPPALLVPDANLILQHVEACLLVARAGITRARSFRQLLEVAPARSVVGEVLNCGRAPSHLRRYEGYHYGEDGESDPPPRRERRRQRRERAS